MSHTFIVGHHIMNRLSGCTLYTIRSIDVSSYAVNAWKQRHTSNLWYKDWKVTIYLILKCSSPSYKYNLPYCKQISIIGCVLYLAFLLKIIAGFRYIRCITKCHACMYKNRYTYMYMTQIHANCWKINFHVLLQMLKVIQLQY